MVIGFKKRFVQPIMNGTKIHTLRLDPHDRWQPGKTMHMATGVRTKQYHNFKTDKCIGYERITMEMFPAFTLYIGNIAFPNYLIEQFAVNDGFESIEDMYRWFYSEYPKERFIYLKLIHWTDFWYSDILQQ